MVSVSKSVDIVNIEPYNVDMVNIKHGIKQLWRESSALTATGLLMLAALIVFVAGIALDQRTVTGAPAWLKPAKFAISTAIFVFTIAWLLRYVTIWRSFVKVISSLMSAILVLEVGIIAFQAARGVPSHFNISSRFDGVLFAIMGTAIVMLWLMTIGIFVALLRQRFENTAWGWWLRLGVLITIIGSAAGGSMLRIKPDQIAQKRAGERMIAIGGHTVGAQDGGRGLPGTGWSTEHGDLRVAHFVGLHGMQILPFLGWAIMRRHYRMTTQIRLAFVTAASYATLLVIVWWQALRGQSIVAPDDRTLAALAIWMTATIVAIFMARGANAVHTAHATKEGV